MTTAAIGSLVVFLVVYFFIASEKVDKTVAAIIGAAIVILLKFVPYEEALHAIDLNVILLLVGMMLVMSMLAETGVFEWLAVTIAKRSNGNGVLIFLQFLFVTAVVSAFLDNVTTVILIAPITILMAELLVIPAVPLLILEAIASNIGGTATLIGDPPNILIGSQAGISFNAFIVHLAPVIVITCILVFPVLAYIFRKKFHVHDDARGRLVHMKPELAILDPVGLKKGLAVLFLMILGFFLSRFIGLEPGIVAIGGAMVMSLVCKKSLHHALEKVEWNTVFFFVGLFMLVGALEYNGIFESLGNWMLSVTGGDLLATVMLILWFSAISSAIVDNIPLVMAMIPLIQGIVPEFASQTTADGQPLLSGDNTDVLYWALALGACLGGNGTLVGASANVVVSQIARRNRYTLTFMNFTWHGLPVMFVTLVISTIYLYVRYFVF